MTKRINLVYLWEQGKYKAVDKEEYSQLLENPDITVYDCEDKVDINEAIIKGEWVGSNPLPRDLCAKGTEHGHQAALFCWAAAVANAGIYPQLKMMFAIPNGGARGDNKFSAAKTGALMKAEGVRKGVPDLFLPVPVKARPLNARRASYVIGVDVNPTVNIFSGLFIEMKINGGVVSDAQKEMINALIKNGYVAAVCYSWDEAADLIVSYLGS